MITLDPVFELSAASPNQFPHPDVPEIVFVGRSNVGKSTLLNSITGRKNIAKVSKTPGKTRQINFFRIDDIMRFVDLPGYGFAKVAQTEKVGWSKLIMRYLQSERPIALVLQLIDSRHKLQELDAEMLGWLVAHRFPVQIVLTKVDKLTQKDRSKQERELRGSICAVGCNSPLLPFSSIKGYGKKELIKIIFQAAGVG